MPIKHVDEIRIENAKIMFKNFSGEESKFNRKGDRNFCLIIEDPDMSQKLLEDGWNVRCRPARDEDDAPTCYIPVAVKFEPYPPRIIMVTGSNNVELDEEAVSVLDHADIKSIDIIVRPYSWETANGKSGIKAYLKTMYVVINEDPFAHKYSCGPEDMPWNN